MDTPNARARVQTVGNRTIRPSSECMLDSRGDDGDTSGLGREVGEEGDGVRLSNDDGAAEEVKVQRPIGRRRRDQRRASGSVDQDQKMKGAR